MDGPARGRVAHRIAHQVGERRHQFMRGACDLDAGRRREVQRVRLAQDRRQGLSFLLALRDHRRGQRPFAAPRQRTAFEPGQREQVAHQGLHPVRLLGHQAEVARALLLVQWQVLQGFDEPHQHRERRADLVRDIGHEIAAHDLGLLHGGHIARQQQRASLAVGMQPHGQLDRPRRGTSGACDHDLLVPPPAVVVGREGRVAHEVVHLLLQVPPEVEPELLGGRLVRPLDASLGVQQDDAVRRSLDRRQEFLQPLPRLGQLLLTRAQDASCPVRDFGPEPGHRGWRREVAAPQPAQDAPTAHAVHDQPPQPAGHEARAHPAVVAQPPPGEPAGQFAEQETEEAPCHR